MQLRCTALSLLRARRSLRDPRKERWSLKLTRHNGRAGKHGTYNPKHNDRSFDIANSEHIDPERVQQNIYWDCYNGIRFALQPKDVDSLADTFEEVEKLYYKLHYTNFTERQNERNAKIRHTERNRSTEDLLTSKKTCPEESIYQLGTLESHASPKELFQIATEFMDEFHERFGKHVHILDWALHLDEGTPHIHERHVFDCENKYGEIAPQQEKALEALGFELPNQTSPLDATTTARSHLMQPAARCCLRLPNAMVWNWTKCRNTADRLIWKSGTISWQSKKNNLLNRKKPYRNRPLSLKI